MPQEYSPMIKQYLKIKEQNKDAILFYRLGDFYEMFFDDAKLTSKELELTLTGKDCGKGLRAPMCGIPYHSCEGYIKRLVDKGYKIAICEQIGETSSKGLVEREVVRVITPGTIIESTMLDEEKNSYLCSICAQTENDVIGFCVCDVSTGKILVTKLPQNEFEKNLQSEIFKFKPKEILYFGEILLFENLKKYTKDLKSSLEYICEKPEKEEIEKLIKEQFANIEAEALAKEPEIADCVAILLKYLEKTQITGIERLNNITWYKQKEYVSLNPSTIKNLELLENSSQKTKKGSLLWVLDNTKTAMGKRLLRSYIERPLRNISKILSRQNAVEEIYSHPFFKDEIQELLSKVYDLERLLTKVVYGSANGRDLRAICYTLGFIPPIKTALINTRSVLLKKIESMIENLEDVRALIDDSIEEEPPISIKDGGVIKKGYNKDVDMLKADLDSGAGIISDIESKERKATGISKLKIGYNKVFGYFIEVSNSQTHKVPTDYIRKQTLSNCERYVTEELKNLENRILSSRQRSIILEYELFVEIRKKVAQNLGRIQKTADALARLDVICSFASVALDNNYTKPMIVEDGKIEIKDGRHPVVELLSKDNLFVPNDSLLDGNLNRCLIITGPNMAGKSTFMRQTAIITIMAQIGSFVPAASAKICVVDSIFTRVGASDDLSSGKSTFMVEMMEVANILKSATKDSLVILDEIGRGTSTFDGMSIARAVVEFICDKKKIGSKTLFSTHYHELTELEDKVEGVKNYNIAAKKSNGTIVFLRRIVQGGADDSYGIEVAKLAGVPQNVVNRAQVILKELENEGFTRPQKPKQGADVKDQMSFKISQDSILAEKIRKIDINTLTPIEALNILSKLIKESNV